MFFSSGSKSQSALWNAITAGIGIKGKEQKPPLNDPRSPEEILAEDLPATDEPDATEKTAIRFACVRWLYNQIGMRLLGVENEVEAADISLSI